MQDELLVLAKTDHPNITRVIELLEDEVNFYIITEIVKGGELFDHILEKKFFDENKTANYIK